MPASWNFNHRIYEPEIMDSGSVSNKDMREGLEFLRKTNRFLGGNRIILHYLNQFSKSWDKNEPIRILDVGCGLGDIPLAIVDWAKSRNYKIQMTGIDLIPQITQMAREHTSKNPNIKIKTGDIFLENIEPKSYDYVTASLFLHHLNDSQLNLALKKFNQIAKRGMILSDLYRSLWSYWAISLTSTLLGNEMVKHDGPLSVRRAFTLPELKNLAKQNDLTYLKARVEPFLRVSLAGEKLGTASR